MNGKAIVSSSPIIFGEVLYDYFEDGSRVLGGAPFNVAWNLAGLGLEPRFVSAVGNDSDGTEILNKMQAWGLSTEFVTRSNLPTGKVAIELEAGQPKFQILPDQAYDSISMPEVKEISCLYFGSLAYRSKQSRRTLGRIRELRPDLTFVDINIRLPWFDREWSRELLNDVDWLKLNDNELEYLTGRICKQEDAVFESIDVLRSEHGFRNCCVTRGEKGAIVSTFDGSTYSRKASDTTDVKDTVGAGDAFSAAFLAGLTYDVDCETLLSLAVNFAAHACRIQGATSDSSDHYGEFKHLFEPSAG